MPITTDGLKVGLTAGSRVYDLKALGWTPDTVSPNYRDALFIVCSSETDMMGGDPDAPARAEDSGVLQTGIGEDVKFGSLDYSDGNGTGVQYGKMFTEPEVVAGAPNKVKSYLSGSCVLPIAKAGTVQTILFALGHAYDSHDDNSGLGLLYIESGMWGNGYNYALNFDDVPPISAGTTGPIDFLGDMFMGIQVSPGIPVTAGGFLTIKGYDGSTENSKNFTYITLESGV